MTRLVWLAIVAAAAYRSGFRQGHLEGQSTTLAAVRRVYSAGVKG